MKTGCQSSSKKKGNKETGISQKLWQVCTSGVSQPASQLIHKNYCKVPSINSTKIGIQKQHPYTINSEISGYANTQWKHNDYDGKKSGYEDQ